MSLVPPPPPPGNHNFSSSCSGCFSVSPSSLQGLGTKPSLKRSHTSPGTLDELHPLTNTTTRLRRTTRLLYPEPRFPGSGQGIESRQVLADITNDIRVHTEPVPSTATSRQLTRRRRQQQQQHGTRAGQVRPSSLALRRAATSPLPLIQTTPTRTAHNNTTITAISPTTMRGLVTPVTPRTASGSQFHNLQSDENDYTYTFTTPMTPTTPPRF